MPCPICSGRQLVDIVPLWTGGFSVSEPCPALGYDSTTDTSACVLPDGTFDLSPYAKVA